MGHIVIPIDTSFLVSTCAEPNNYNYNEPIDVKLEPDIDMVFICQSDFTFRVLTDKPIVYYHSEFTWYPSCVNATYIISTFPEMKARFRRFYPTFLKSVREFIWIQHFVVPSDYKNVRENKKDGIFWMGTTCTDGHDEYVQRTIYDTRCRIVGELQSKGLIESFMYDYSKNYNQIMSKYKGGLVIDGTGAFFSPRSIEYLGAGVIPIIYIGTDRYARKYYEMAGFKHNVNCWFFNDWKEVEEFNTLDKENTDRLRSQGRVLLNEQYKYDKKLGNLFKIINLYNEMIG